MKNKLIVHSVSLEDFQVHIPVCDTNSFSRVVKRVNELSLTKKKKNSQEVIDYVHDSANLVSQVGSALTGELAVGGLVGIALQLVLKTSLSVAKSYAKHHDIQALKKAIDLCASSCKIKNYEKARTVAELGLREVERFDKLKLVGFLTNHESDFKNYRFALKLLLKYNLAAAYYGQFVITGKNDLTLIEAASKNIDDIFKSLRGKYIDASSFLKDINNELHLVLGAVKNNLAVEEYERGNFKSARYLGTVLTFDCGSYSFDAKQRAKEDKAYHDDPTGLAICDVLKANQAQFSLLPRHEGYDILETQFDDNYITLSPK